MGDKEISTNLTFIQMLTMIFELHPANAIKIDEAGNVINLDSRMTKNKRIHQALSLFKYQCKKLGCNSIYQNFIT